jgi:hypothetical protein
MKHACLYPLFLLLPWLLTAQNSFTKITDGPPATFPNSLGNYKGVAWIDLDGDYRTDLFVNQRFLFRNLGNGNFVQLPNLAPVASTQSVSGSSWGDVDNDGDPDLILSAAQSALYRNNGDLTFTAETGLFGSGAYAAWDVAMADADLNGRLDLVFVHANGFHGSNGPFPGRFFLQTTEGVFEQNIGYEFTDVLAPYTVPVWADYDLDGDADLFIGAGPAGQVGPDFCYRNLLKETGTFSLERLQTPPFDAPQDGQTYNFPDYDNDGDRDICLTNYGGAPTRFWRNDNGTYQALGTPFTEQGTFLSNVWGDIDNDGDLDVLITRDGNINTLLYRNQGDGTFSPVEIAGTGDGSPAGIALADYDNDGDLDVYVNGAGTARSLFRNEAQSLGRHWFHVSLEGVASNRSAIGARLRLKTVIDGQPLWQQREVQAHNSFQSMNDLRQHFGLGDAAAADSLIVHWPSGLTEAFANLAADKFYRVVEGQGIGMVSSAPAPGPGPELQIRPNPVRETFEITLHGAVADIARVEVVDSSGRRIEATWTPQGDRQEVRLPKDLAPGTYFVRTTLRDGGSVTQPFVRL